ncbi:MAG: GNAT family N-acetyltransferase [Chitinophagales bacterium]
MLKSYLFESDRLGFRSWETSDLDNLAELCADPDVMAYFPKTLNLEESKVFLQRLQEMYLREGLTYYAVELKSNSQFLGFIGFAKQEYEAEFNPSIDIGWRLLPKFWKQGYAYEGAQACLEYGFTQLNLKKVVAVCSISNSKSERLMQKLGMRRKGSFKHPYRKNFPPLEACCWYEIKK